MNRKLTALIATTLMIQLGCRYYYEAFVWHHFRVLNFFLQWLVPLIVSAFVLKIRWRDLGLRLPTKDRAAIMVVAGVTIVVPVVIGLAASLSHYQSYYESFNFTNERMQDFALFTASTILGWEFLHRGFLLFGLISLLKNLRVQAPQVLAILWVMTFEVLYHFQKPDVEAWGMLLFSPLLSWIALRTKSIYVAMALHLWVELWFFVFVAGAR